MVRHGMGAIRASVVPLAALLIVATFTAGCGGDTSDDAGLTDEPDLTDDSGAIGNDTTTIAATGASATIVVLKRANDPGTSPFTSNVSKVTGSRFTSSSTRQGPVKATEPGLYGSVRGQSACDTTALVDELSADLERNEAFAGVLDIEPADVRAMVGGMVAVVLRSDTLAVDHEYVGGRAISKDAVLEAGTPVLVDYLGIPRIRCTSGSPLQPLAGLPDGAEFEGPGWDDFQPQSVISVVPADEPIEELVLIDPDTLEPFLRGLPNEEIPLDAEPVDLDIPPTADLDGDGTPDLIELEDDSVYADADADSDGDGIPDAIEALIGSDPTVADIDADGDGIPDDFATLFEDLAFDVDADGDGIPDAFADLFDALPDIDLDGDGVPDDLGDPFADIPSIDIDGDGVPDDLGAGFSDTPPIDLDGDGVPDDPFADPTPPEPPVEEPPAEEPPAEEPPEEIVPNG